MVVTLDQAARGIAWRDVHGAAIGAGDGRRADQRAGCNADADAGAPVMSLGRAAGGGERACEVGAVRVAAVILDLVMVVSIRLKSGRPEAAAICMGRVGPEKGSNRFRRPGTRPGRAMKK